MINIDVKKTFPAASVNISMDLSTDRTVLFGPSGSGKSTLLKMITGFYTPDSGRISIDKTTLYNSKQRLNLPIHHRNIAYLPQDYTLFPHLNIQDNILYGLRTKKIPLRKKLFREIVNKLEIQNILSARPAELSGGQQQRIALARILMIQPRIILLDEPFSALDNTIRNTLRELVLQLSKENNIPTLLVTHDLEEAMMFSENIFVILEGAVAEHGKITELCSAPKYAETARLFGLQTWNIKKENDIYRYMLREKIIVAETIKRHDDTYICIRPENIKIVSSSPLNSGLTSPFLAGGKIVDLRHHTNYMRIFIRSNSGEQYISHVPQQTCREMTLQKGDNCVISIGGKYLNLCRAYSRHAGGDRGTH